MVNNETTYAENQIANCAQYVEVDEVPIIDLEKWFNGEDKDQVVAKVGDALERVGFFMIKNHNVDERVLEDMFDVSRRFFDLPTAVKEETPMKPGYPYGYEASEVLVGSLGGEEKRPDLKETFQVCIGSGKSEKVVHWPRSPDDFQEKYTKYYRACETLANELLQIFACALELPPNWFVDKCDDHLASCRSLNYPEQVGAFKPAPGQLRATPHTDYGTLTILAVGGDATGGLQVMKKNDEWLDVDIPQGCFTINIGDMMARWTNDRWRSTMHRVVNPTDISRRQSVAFFHNPNHDAMVDTIPTCITPSNPNKYRPVTGGQYLMNKHNAANQATSGKK